MDLSSSVNTIFAVTGPSAGVLQVCTASASLAPSAARLDDSVWPIVSGAFEAVSVPAAQYWLAASRLSTTTPTNPQQQQQQQQQSKHQSFAISDETPLLTRRPDPCDVSRSFYATRVDAISHRRYEANRGTRIVAADVRSGSTAKQFTAMGLDSLYEFISAVPNYARRNFYIVLDESAPVDPFFDLDCSLPLDGALDALDWESALADMLEFLRTRVEAATGAALQRCVVLTSSVLVKDTVTDDDEEEEEEEEREKEKEKEGEESEWREIEEIKGEEERRRRMLRKKKRRSRSRSRSEERERLLSSADSKLSFHVHFRLAQRTAFANIQSLHQFMSALREELNAMPQPSLVHRLLRRCVDFGVYTRWRNFRLPYCVKAPDSSAIDAAALELFAPEAIHRVRVGAAASSVVHTLDKSAILSVGTSQQRRQQWRRVTGMFFVYRFLLPLVPGVTRMDSAELAAFLSAYPIRKSDESSQHDPHQHNDEAETEETQEKEKYELRHMGSANDKEEDEEKALARDVFDLATIQRDRRTTAYNSNISKHNEHVDRFITIAPPSPSQPHPQDPHTTRSDETTPQNNEDPFSVPRPPLRDGVRTAVRDPTVRGLVAEVFRCICAAYDGSDKSIGGGFPISGERISVQYQDNIRAYYATQKQSRFCLRVNRLHRGTYPQLYLTYGSIKLRCYSNDCCGSCLAVPWALEEQQLEGEQEEEEDAARDLRRRELTRLPVGADGFPKYARLAEIRNLLFPQLPLDELMRRYGTSVLSQK